MLSNPSERYKDQTTTLTPDQQAVVVREARESMFALKTLADTTASDPEVSLELAFNILWVTESRVAELCKLLGLELDSAKEREERYAKLREANMRVHNLERLLGQAAGPDVVKQGVNVMIDKLRAWWETHGMGYTSEAHVTGSGLSAKFSCSLGMRSFSYSRTPVSDRQSEKEWLASLQERGFVVVHKRNDDPALAATEANQNLLIELLKNQFPSARPFSFKGYLSHDTPTLQEIEVFFPDLKEIAALPELPPHE